MKFQIIIIFSLCLSIFAVQPAVSEIRPPVPAVQSAPARPPVPAVPRPPVPASAPSLPDVCTFVPKQACYLLSQTCILKDNKCVFKFRPNSNQPKESKPGEKPNEPKPQAGFDPCVLLSPFLCAFSSNNVCYVDSHGHCASRIPIPGTGHK